MDKISIPNFVVTLVVVGVFYFIINRLTFKDSFEGEEVPATQVTAPATEVVAPAVEQPVAVPAVETKEIEAAAKADPLALLPVGKDPSKGLQELLQSQNLLISGFASGLHQSNRKNGNLQLRSDPIIPKQDVSPFQQSTIQPDVFRKKFEIGQ